MQIREPSPVHVPGSHGAVVSVNVGRPQDLPWRGTTVRTAFRKTPVAGAVEISGTNLVGDDQADTEVHGGRDKCLFVYPIEHYPHWEAWLPWADLGPGSFGENLTLRGLDEASVALGDTFRIGSAEVIVTEPRQPCYKIDVSLQRDGAAAEMVRSGRVGFYLGLVRAGCIQAGDAVEYLDGPRVDRISPGQLHQLSTNAQPDDVDRLERVANSPHVSDWWAEMLRVKAAALRRRARRSNPPLWAGRRTFAVSERCQEAPDVVSLWLSPVDAAPLPPIAGGQFVTLELPPAEPTPSGDDAVVRCYSISAATDRALRVTVRRAEKSTGGSAAACELRPGTHIGLRAPAGDFTLHAHPAGSAVVLVSGGIGITPILGMARDWVRDGGANPLLAIHAMHTAADDALLAELAELLTPHDNATLEVFVAHGAPPITLGATRIHRGRLDRPRLGRALDGVPKQAHAYLCGPIGLVEALQHMLPDLGIAPSAVHTEVFAAPSAVGGEIQVPPGGIEVMFAQRAATMLWADAATSLLDLAEDAGVDIPSSCRQGICGTCVAPVLSGEVQYLRAPAVPIPDGACLACVAVPASRLVLDA